MEPNLQSPQRSKSAKASAPWLAAMPWLLAVLVAGGVGATFEPGAWYATLDKPQWTPPGVTFSIAWTFLYASMVYVGARLSLAPRSPARTLALVLMGVQLLLNAAWSWLFFGMHWIALAFIDICLLWLSVVMLIVIGVSVDRRAAIVTVPYVLWLSFALVLNGCIMLLN